MLKITLKHILTFVSMAASTLATAQSFDAVRLYGVAPGSDGGLIGVAAIDSSEYRGSDERRRMLVPLLDYQWKTGWFAGTGNGIGYNFSTSPTMQYGVRITADFGRKENRSQYLKGMGDIDAKPEFGAFFNLSTSREFTFTSSVRSGSRGTNEGTVLDFGAVYSRPLAPNLRLSFGVAGSLADSKHMNTYFGVSANQAKQTAYSFYEAKAGLRDVRANFSTNYMFNQRTSLTMAISVSNLMDQAKKSPLTRSDRSISGVAAFAYAF